MFQPIRFFLELDYSKRPRFYPDPTPTTVILLAPCIFGAKL